MTNFELTESQSQWALLAGRILIGMIFVMGGIQKLMGGVGALASTIDAVTWLPLPALFAVLTIVIELGVGLLFVFGLQTKKAALILAVTTLIITYFFHPGWADPEQMIPMMKNLGLVGGFLAYMAVGPGRISLERKFEKIAQAEVQNI